MKYLRLIILMLLPVLIPLVVSAETKETTRPYFSKYQNEQWAEYAYMSPLMIKAMNMNDSDLEGFPAKKVSTIEVLSLKYNAASILKNAIESCIKENDMTLIGSVKNKAKNSSNTVSSELYAKVEGNDRIKQLLILKWGPFNNSVRLLHIVGNFSLDDIKDKL